MLTLRKASPPTDEWKEISLGDTGTLEVRIKRPTWDDLMVDAEMASGYNEHRLRTCVLDWRGVVGEGEQPQPVPFSFESFKALCVAFPKLAVSVGVIVAAHYRGLTDQIEKKSDAPSGLPSTDSADSQAETNTATV